MTEPPVNLYEIHWLFIDSSPGSGGDAGRLGLDLPVLLLGPVMIKYNNAGLKIVHAISTLWLAQRSFSLREFQKKNKSMQEIDGSFV
jgi:hypothetical protein